MPTNEQIIAQSKAAYNQWAPQWRLQAKEHATFKMKHLSDFENRGIGRAILCIANGYSFEENIETIKKYQDKVDIMVCDKTLGHCLNNGIKPTYVIVCDANVSYEKYLAPWKDQVKDITLFSNVCGNPKWTKEAKWRDIYFFVNKDVLHSEREFCQLSGCPNVIAAATNVSNAMVVFLTQSDERGRNNFFGYDKILLIGYDYSWRPGGKYYAFDSDGSGKFNYMRHLLTNNLNNNLSYTSGNLAFSAEWLDKYIKTFNLPVVQCSRETIMPAKAFGELEKQMQYKFRPNDSQTVRGLVKKKNELMIEMNRIDANLRQMGKEHFYSYLSTI